MLRFKNPGRVPNTTIPPADQTSKGKGKEQEVVKDSGKRKGKNSSKSRRNGKGKEKEEEDFKGKGKGKAREDSVQPQYRTKLRSAFAPPLVSGSVEHKGERTRTISKELPAWLEQTSEGKEQQ